MADRVRKAFPFRLILLVLMGAVLLYLGSGFVCQMSVGSERRAELHQIEQGIEAAQQEKVQLEEYLHYVQSAEAAEEWARENGWAKEDEVSVVLVAPATESPTVEGRTLGEGTEPGSNREAWWELFFGAP
jgi:hypothetical protein